MGTRGLARTFCGHIWSYNLTFPGSKPLCKEVASSWQKYDHEGKAELTYNKWLDNDLLYFPRFLHHCATVIQRQYRGHLDRIWYRGIVQDAVVEMRERYYNSMATKVVCRDNHMCRKQLQVEGVLCLQGISSHWDLLDNSSHWVKGHFSHV